MITRQQIIDIFTAIKTAAESIKDTDGIKKITDALPAGTNLLGKVGIDQTTDGTTNKVHVGNTVDVQVTGSILADDGLGNPVPLTAVLDGGKYYLGTMSMDFVEEGDPLG